MTKLVYHYKQELIRIYGEKCRKNKVKIKNGIVKIDLYGDGKFISYPEERLEELYETLKTYRPFQEPDIDIVIRRNHMQSKQYGKSKYADPPNREKKS